MDREPLRKQVGTGLARDPGMAGLLLASVWCLLLLGAALRAPLALTYLACAVLLTCARPAARVPAASGAALLACTAGFVALPAWLALIVLVGRGLGWAPPPALSLEPAASDWLAHVALAPLFEELLYRERLLPALRARVGAPLALVLSSALFAAPHLEAWSVLTTFCVGLVLGGVFLATGGVALCVAYHAGLNAAVLVCGLPLERAALPPIAAACVATGLLGLACVWTRRLGPSPWVHEVPPPRALRSLDGA